MDKRHNVTPENDWFLLLSAFIGIVVVFWIFLENIVYWSCTLLYHLWMLCDFPRIHTYVAERINLLAATANSADNVTLMQWIDVMNRTAGILLLFLVPLAIMGIYSTVIHPVNKTRREVNIHTLPWIMARFSPSIIPALCYGDKKSQLLNVDPAEHRSALDPSEFAQRHKLVIDRRLNHDLATKVFTRQLGTRISNLKMEDLNPYERALFTAFGLQFFLNDRKAAETLLDTLNRSCLIKSRRDNGKIGYPVLSAANIAFKKISTNQAAQAWLKQHCYARTAIAALHANDLHLPNARFRWLKGLDRSLWYALCSSDRPKAFIEGAGIVTMAQWEREAALHNERIPTSVVIYAVEGLELDLMTVGAVIDDRIPVDEEDFAFDDESDDEGDSEDIEWTPAPLSPKREVPQQSPNNAPPEPTRAPFALKRPKSTF